jgi:hypothetical protein
MAQKVYVDYDHSANFANYHTWAWMKGTPAQDPLFNQRIISGIEAQLAAKGLQQVSDPEAADMLVAYHASTTTKTQINTYNMGWGWWGGGMGTADIDKVPVGSLIVDMADPKAKKFLWRGRASDTLSANPEKVEKMLNNSMKKMFEKFPPMPK